MGESEKILGSFVAGEKREDVEVSTKFTPQLAEVYENSLEKMALASIDRMGIDYIDMYWIHNPMDVERWTPGLIPLLQSEDRPLPKIQAGHAPHGERPEATHDETTRSRDDETDIQKAEIIWTT